MPTLWRTIAPIIERTAAECLERYEYLLDQAQNKEESEDAVDDSRKLKRARIPTQKPNQQDLIPKIWMKLSWKCCQRLGLVWQTPKERKLSVRVGEKQLEEARRLAAIQKRRELRAARIEVTSRRKKKT